ncbi:MAG: NRDE family protein [Deltaproteobacteria bacterium]|nr:NRDE family protein [Deltaproteobacteria bacterium]
MCTLAFYFQSFPHYPIVAAANRDESLSRPSATPRQLSSSPWIYGGQDLLAGGTWLAVNEHGMIAAILNRHTGRTADPHCRSRGLLCLEALKYSSVRQAVDYVNAQSPSDYNPFNLLIADHTEAFVIHAQAPLFETQPLRPGFHLLTNYNLNDLSCPRTKRSSPDFARLPLLTPAQPLAFSDICAQLHPLLATHAPDPDPRASVCIHLDGYGTCSSSVLAYSQTERRYRYTFAPGSPCRNTYSEVSIPPGGCASHPPSTT